MKIAIPSFDRENVVTWFKFSQIYDKNDITIFVHDDTQKVKYLAFNPEYKIVVTNVTGIQRQRNAILDYFPENEKILMLDDDVYDVYSLGNKCLIKLDNVGIKDFIENAFNQTESAGAKLWGIYPIKNHFFMNNKVHNKAFIAGAFCGIINNTLRYDDTLDVKEDFDYMLKSYIKYGKVMRFNNITAEIKRYSNKGGCSAIRANKKKNVESKCCKRLLKMYPDHLMKNKKRKNELLIKR